jgi:hypothetical protein
LNTSPILMRIIIDVQMIIGNKFKTLIVKRFIVLLEAIEMNQLEIHINNIYNDDYSLFLFNIFIYFYLFLFLFFLSITDEARKIALTPCSPCEQCAKQFQRSERIHCPCVVLAYRP